MLVVPQRHPSLLITPTSPVAYFPIPMPICMLVLYTYMGFKSSALANRTASPLPSSRFIVVGHTIATIADAVKVYQNCIITGKSGSLGGRAVSARTIIHFNCQ